MAEAGEYSLTKVIQWIIVILLLVLIVVGSISGQINPLIDKIGAKFDELTLKNKQTQTSSEIIGDLQVNPNGTCMLINVGTNKNNYSYDSFSGDFNLNEEDINSKLLDGNLDGELDVNLDNLAEERELYYTIIQELEDEGILDILGKNTNFNFMYDSEKTYSLFWENNLGILIPSSNEETTYFTGNNIPEDEVKKTDLIWALYNKATDFMSGIAGNINSISQGKEDILASLTFIEQTLKNEFLATTPNEYSLSKIDSLISKGEEIEIGESAYQVIDYITSSEEYLLLEIKNIETKKTYFLQFTSNYIYFMDLITDKGYSRAELNNNNYLFYEEDSSYPYKEYILTDEAFNEMLEINKAYEKLKDNCV